MTHPHQPSTADTGVSPQGVEAQQERNVGEPRDRPVAAAPDRPRARSRRHGPTPRSRATTPPRRTPERPRPAPQHQPWP
jgi:hypothetical protein